jgi:hypothetical protein
MNIGDHIKVKDGIKDPDFPKNELSGDIQGVLR